MTATAVALILAGLAALALTAAAIGWPYTLGLACLAVALTFTETNR